MANVNIRVDDALKKQAEAVFDALGLSLSAATNVFYKQVVRTGGIPFPLQTDPFYSERNQAHLRKAIAAHDKGKTRPIIKTLDELKAMEDE
jgi:DNA-damage-inducible protein J